jgi:hypothetical protein
MGENRVMSVSAAQADAFYREVVEHSTVWGVRDAEGFPVPEAPEGRAMPLWSLRSRAEGIVAKVPAYAGFEVVGLPLATGVRGGCRASNETGFVSA